MPTLDYSPQAVPLTTDPGGTVRVRGTRVLFDLVIHAFQRGTTPEEIVRMYDTLDVADIYLVIGYYLKNRAACDEYIREGEARGVELRAFWEARAPFPANFKEILLERLRAAGLKEAIDAGLEDMRQGRVAPFDPMALLAEVKSEFQHEVTR